MDTIFKLKATLLDEEETLTPYTMDDINAMMDESEADEKAGRTISGEEMSRRMDKFIASL